MLTQLRLGVLLLILSSLVQAELLLPKASPVPGGIALVPLAIEAEQPPHAYFNDQRLLVVDAQAANYPTQARWLAVVGIPLSTELGQQRIKVGDQQFQFKVHDKQYREQRLKIKNKRKVNPNAEDLKRIRKEKSKMLKALAHWSEPEQLVTRFQRPAAGPFSSPFGLRRFFNDQPRRPHSGLDIAAAKGTPIVAPAPATVVDSGDYFFNGRNLILDHGRGLVTMYSHMDSIEVAVGDRVEAGQHLGTIGNSGRVTGPHLHWSVSLNNARVDPMLFLRE